MSKRCKIFLIAWTVVWTPANGLPSTRWTILIAAAIDLAFSTIRDPTKMARHPATAARTTRTVLTRSAILNIRVSSAFPLPLLIHSLLLFLFTPSLIIYHNIILHNLIAILVLLHFSPSQPAHLVAGLQRGQAVVLVLPWSYSPSPNAL
jgi:hypothetical protein